MPDSPHHWLQRDLLDICERTLSEEEVSPRWRHGHTEEGAVCTADARDPCVRLQMSWFLYQSLIGLDYLHSQHVIHRDVKVPQRAPRSVVATERASIVARRLATFC